jgi:prophage DNA circulation protein
MTNVNPLPLTQGSNSAAPDLDWSQVRETVKLLNLAVSHIEESMHVGDDSIDTLTDSFTTMAGDIQSIQKSVEELPDSVSSTLSKEMADKCSSLKQQVHNAIIAFQFYDRLIQKLTHVSHSMDTMADLIIDQARLFNPHEWTALQEKIRSSYTMESERLMFDALMNGASIQEAMEQAEKHDGVNGQTGEIDLF